MKRILTLLWEGVKKNYKAALILQGFALVIVVSYYLFPQWNTLLSHLGDIKQQGGYLFSALATMAFGGIFPYLIFVLNGDIKGKERVSHLVFYIFFWMWKGAEVDLLYRLQAHWFGSEPSVGVVLVKMAVDQFIYGPLWAAPTMTLFYLWKDSGFSFVKTKKALGEEGPVSRIVTVLVSNMIVWIPSVCIIYSLPLNLQLPLFNIVLLFWALILHFVVRRK